MKLDDVLRVALAWLATYGLHSTLFLGTAWLLCALRPAARNRNRERLWKLALVGGLLSATLQLGLGARPLLGRLTWRPAEPQLASASVDESVLAPRSGAAPAQVSIRHGADESTAPPEDRPGETHLAGAVAAEERPSPGPEVVTMLAEEEAAPEPTGFLASTTAAQCVSTRLDSLVRRVPPHWTAGVFAGWMLVGLGGVLTLAASWAALRRRMAHRRLLRDGPLVAQLDELRRRARMRTPVRLSVSERIRAPFSTGLVRPEICVPSAVLTQLSPAQQEALLAHELAHLVRRDPLWFGLSFLCERVFFFQPLNRVARRRLSELAEVACDDWAVRWTGARLALASCLAEVAGWVVGERVRSFAPPNLAGQRSRLAQRVKRLLDDRLSPAGDPAAAWWPPLAVTSLALAALTAPGVSAERPRASHSLPRTAPRSPRTVAHAPAAESSVEEMADERATLEAELALLDGELAALRAELDARALRERFDRALHRIDERMETLRDQHARVRALLSALLSPNPPASEPAPAAFPASTVNPGNSR